MDSNNLIEGLLQKPLWQMTGEEYSQPQLADCLATLLFPYREVGIKLPTTLKRWQNPGKPGSG